jgi:hypothetical protein
MTQWRTQQEYSEASMPEQEPNRPHFLQDDPVRVDGELGSIVKSFPDGIYFVRIAGSGRIIATTAEHLTPADLETDERPTRQP